MKVKSMHQTIEGELPLVGMSAYRINLTDNNSKEFFTDDIASITGLILSQKAGTALVFSKIKTREQISILNSIIEKIVFKKHKIVFEIHHDLAQELLDRFTNMYSPHVDYYSLNIISYNEKTITKKGLTLSQKIYYKFEITDVKSFYDHCIKYREYFVTGRYCFRIKADTYESWLAKFNQLKSTQLTSDFCLSPSFNLAIGFP